MRKKIRFEPRATTTFKELVGLYEEAIARLPNVLSPMHLPKEMSVPNDINLCVGKLQLTNDLSVWEQRSCWYFVGVYSPERDAFECQWYESDRGAPFGGPMKTSELIRTAFNWSTSRFRSEFAKRTHSLDELRTGDPRLVGYSKTVDEERGRLLAEIFD